MRALIVTASVLVFLVPRAYGQELPSLKEIRAHLETQLLTLDPIAVEFTVVSERPPNVPKNVPWADKPHHWTWTKSGSRERLVMDECHYERLGLFVNHDESIDGRELTRLMFSTRQSKTITHVIHTDELMAFGNHLSPAHFLGARLRNTEATLLSLLSSSGAELAGWSEVDGERCVTIIADPVKDSRGNNVRWEFHLSPSHRFLARRILARYTVRRPQEPEDPTSEVIDFPIEYVYSVTSFRRLSDKGIELNRYFPTDCEMVSGEDVTKLVVISVDLHDVSSPGRGIPAGIETQTIVNGRPVKRQSSGPESVNRVRESILRETPPSPPADQSLDARPRESLVSQWGSWAISAALLTSAVAIWWRSK